MFMEDNEKTTTALIVRDIGYIKESLKDIKDQLASKFVTKEEFKPVKILVYGFTGLILTSVVGALLLLIIKR